MKVFERIEEGSEVQYVTTKCVINTFEDHNAKSYRFTGTADVFGVDTDVSGYFAKSLDRTYKEGDKVSITVKGSILDGTDEELDNPGEPCNYLWSISRGGADDLTTDQIDKLKALLGK